MRNRKGKREVVADRVQLVMYNLNDECDRKVKRKGNSNCKGKGMTNERQTDGRMNRQTD